MDTTTQANVAFSQGGHQSYQCIASPYGPMVAASYEGALSGLWFEKQKHFPSLDLIAPDDGQNTALWLALTEQLHAYAARDLRHFQLPLHCSTGTRFGQRVWQQLLRIPFGQTTTYGELAAQLGSSPRAVGGAVGRNPIAIIVPCHRVVGASGALTGYAGGITNKAALLRGEHSFD